MNRRSVLVILSIVVALFTGASVASAAPPSIDFGSLGGIRNPLQHGCSTDLYKPGDWRMGAKDLATAPPVGPQVAGYNRLGGRKDADDFIAYWWNPNVTPETWRWPDQDGFVLVNGRPIKRVSTLKVGTRVDRYGGEGGNFVAPEGASYTSRSLPPASLANTESCNYHVYEVIKPLKVYRGPIAPWFGQRGGGTQFQMTDTLIDLKSADCGDKMNIEWLRCAKYLKAVYP